MGIADADARELQRSPCRLDGNLDQFVASAMRAGKRCGAKGRPTHFDGGGGSIAVAIEMERDGDQAALGLDGKLLFLGLAGGMEITGEDAQSIAGLFGLTPIGIEDAQAEVGFLRRDQREDAVTAQTPVTIADAADFSGR